MLCAEEPTLPAIAAPLPEQAILKKFEGEWKATSECKAGPDQTFTCQSTMKGRMLGHNWVIAESEASMGDEKVHAMLTLGYDPTTKKYVGTWVDSAMNHLWKYSGEVNKEGTKISLFAEGPNLLAGGKVTKFEDAYEFKSDDEIHITSKILTEDGQWVQFMSGVAKRVK